MRLATTGSRHWKDYLAIFTELERLKREHGSDLIVCGGVSAGGGADMIVRESCVTLQIEFVPFKVDYNGVDGLNPKTAPLNRNVRMLREFKPDQLYAWRSAGKSNGTDHTIKMATEMHIPTKTFKSV